MRVSAVGKVCLEPLFIAMMMLFPPVRTLAAGGKTAPFAGFTKCVRYHVRYDINADGTYVETIDWALKVLADQGVSDANRESISYSDSLQMAEILSVYTLKKDGRRIEVPASNFQQEVSQGNGTSPPMFSDIESKTVAFPDVGVGDTVAMSYKLTQKEATYPGNFSMIEWFSNTQVNDDVEVRLSAPSSLPIRVFQRGVKGGEIEATDGRRNWIWTYHNQEVVTPESSSVSQLDYGPLIIASTFKDYGALAAAYYARAKPKAEPTAQVKKLADQITQNLKTPSERAKALYDWVAKNIKYAENASGVGSVVPHPADLVIDNRMGDCKDHATVLQALLAAKGIASVPVLINATSAYTLPTIPADGWFNHVITYIPSLAVYADSTSQYTPFGSLPVSDSDKPALFAADYAGIRRTPPTSYRDNGEKLLTVMEIHPDGSADGETKIEAKGFYATTAKASLMYLQPNLEDLVVRRLLNANGYTGTGSIVRGGTGDSEDEYRYSIKFHVDEAVDLPGPGGMIIQSPVAPRRGMITDTLNTANAPPGSVNTQCYGAYWIEKYTIRLPKDLQVLAIPRPIQVASKNADYKSAYLLKNGTISAEREMVDHTAHNVCDPGYAAEFKTLLRPLRRDIRAQFVYK
ncbi:MAG TPA: DUF3857 and transglutaminase domain-containing protein [Candidatus Binataceae bacterium]|nr:DUF3857 and transglutaminase domain-containing protein [Candidatus Binataceae bacterium]